ncbi:restriction endonuclease subunit S [Ensifer sp. ZNC0028]|uniref:restriction endonuclease subunit S n=1 Tax=Ensifer sp. ZNC0028 TaxID=1339236 RepID=UPI00068D1FC6|nr:restriction endonuclease subunit S [Ensifer sp. ZNC0028]
MNSIDGWQGEVPPDWTVRPLRSVAEYAVSNVDKIASDEELPVRLCNYTDVYNNETIHLGIEFMAGTATQAEINKFRLLADDVVITKDSESWEDIAIPALVTETSDDLVCGYHLAMIRPDPKKLDGEFLFRCLQSKVLRIQLELAATGITRYGVPKNAIGSMALPVPPKSVQQVIARFLDKQTSDIDNLIFAKQRVLDLLAEKRRVIVAEAIMRGLNPAVRLRPSGIDWLGDIPAHWQLKRSKWLFEERDERSTDGSEVLLSLRMERGLVPHNDVSEKLTRPEELIGYKKTSVGQLVVNRMRAATGLIAITTQDGLVSPDYAVFWPSAEISTDYYVEMFKTPLLQAVFRSESTGLGTGSQGFLRLYSQNFLALWFPYPPLEEQYDIVRYIATETARIDRLRAAAEHSINLLKERRGALITAAVTGQIDLSEEA